MPKPIPQEINNLLAECDFNNCQPKLHQNSSAVKLRTCLNECHVDEDDDDEDTRSG